MKYTITAEYKVKKELEVEVPEGSDPTDPRNWGEIESEHDTDCWLHDVLSARASE